MQSTVKLQLTNIDVQSMKPSWSNSVEKEIEVKNTLAHLFLEPTLYLTALDEENPYVKKSGQFTFIGKLLYIPVPRVSYSLDAISSHILSATFKNNHRVLCLGSSSYTTLLKTKSKSIVVDIVPKGVYDYIFVSEKWVKGLSEQELTNFYALKMSSLLKRLKRDGSLLLPFKYNHSHSTVELMYLCRACFKKATIERNKFEKMHMPNRTLFLKGYLGNNLFEKVKKSYRKNTVLKSLNLHIQDNNEVEQIGKIIDERKINFERKCAAFMKTIKHNELKELTEHQKNQIEIAKTYCFENKIPIHPEYMNENYISLLQKPNRLAIIQSYFPNEPNINRKKLKLSIEGLFSVSHWKDNELLIQDIRKYSIVPNKSILIDATANVGGVTVSMSKYFHHVYAMELMSSNFDMLKHNVKLYKRTNVTLLKGDCLDLIPQYIEHAHKKYPNYKIVLFFDPPWGGINYRKKKYIDLYLSGVNVVNIIDYYTSAVDAIVLKAPNNFNIKYNYFDQRTKSTRTRFDNYKLLIKM